VALGTRELAGPLAEDTEGNMWVAILHNGVVKIIRNGLITYTEEDGLSANMITRIFEDREGQLYFIGAGWRLHRFVGERIKSVRFNLPARMSDSDFASYHGVIKDHKGEWWVATREGLYRFPRVNSFEDLARARPLAVYTKRDGLVGNDVTRLFEDSRGDIWIATFVPDREVLTRWERATGRFHRYSDREGLPTQSTVTAFGEDSADLWIGFRDSAVARYRDGRFTVFTPKDGLPAGDTQSILADRAGRIWFGFSTERGGLCRVDDPTAEHPRFKVYTAKDGLASNIVRRLAEDHRGRIYADTVKGVDRFDPETELVKHFTIADGLAAQNLYSAFGDRQGHVWFGTFHGLSRITPGPERTTTPPPVFINRFRIGGVDHPLSVFGESRVVGPELDSSQNQIQVDYFGLSFAAGGALDYRYRIEGLDQEWSEPTPQRTVNLSLAPGTYRFVVEAIAPDGTKSASPAELSFTILSPIWQRWWFIALVLMLAGLLVSVFERYRVARLLELERVRTRIATDLHDDIGASLSRIAILSEVAKQQTETGRKEIAGTLTEVADSARELVDSMSDIVWSIDPRKDNLKDVLQRVRGFASDVFEAKHIEWQLDVSPDIEGLKLPPEERRHLLLFFKEAINNVSRHSNCSHARLGVAIRDHQLTTEISDDGRGFDPDELSISTRGGNGLGNMQRRAAEVGGEIDIDSAPGRGTLIRFSFPLKRFS
jgi:signal transduction histidine kinase/streptogramin lyase